MAGLREPAEVRLGVARSCARRFIEGEDSVVAKWLKPPFYADGWRIDVANMTGRLGEVDLNAEVRQLLRETMIDINPDTILLGRVDQRRGERPAGRRLARRDDLPVVHPAAVGLAERADARARTSTPTAAR